MAGISIVAKACFCHGTGIDTHCSLESRSPGQRSTGHLDEPFLEFSRAHIDPVCRGRATGATRS
ncbi:hypothetical protein D5X79_25335, partial [Salmonella enterica subsp. enterica]|nr:hypothetical protein [Salmonella enterica subsp. enterica]